MRVRGNPYSGILTQFKKAKSKTLSIVKGDRKAVGTILVTITDLPKALEYRTRDVLLIAEYSKFRSYI